MRAARLVLCLCLCSLPWFGRGFVWEPALSSNIVAPEPRSFASLSGDADGPAVYLHGGFSHVSSTWLAETWQLQLNGGIPLWKKLREGPPLQHATIVTLNGEVLLAGGRVSGGKISNSLYRLDGSLEWTLAPVQGAAVPPLYRHSAVAYTVGGSPRVLLCGGVNATNQTVTNVYELSYDNSTKEYVFTEMSPLPVGLMGHSLAAGADSVVYLSGGLSGGFDSLPSAALPPKLAAAMDASQAGGALAASARVYKFSRNATDPSANGSWSELGSTARPVAFHASWRAGSALYLFGGAQGRSEANSTASYGLQVVQLPDNDTAAASPAPSLYNPTAVQEADRVWGAVQPGRLSGAAVWVNESATSPSEARVWLFGGWRTPQPLPDTYLSPQDSSLTWRLGGGGTDPWVAASWLAPLQGGMAPRAAAGLMSLPVTVGGSRKLLVLGGRSPQGWTGATAASTTLSYLDDPDRLPMPPGNGLLDSAESYQLYDIWLIDQATGEREAVWNVVGDSAAPFGSPASPAAVGRLWDRRLLEYHPAVGASLGGSGTALYLQTEEVVATGGGGSTSLQSGIWSLTLSLSRMNTTAGPFNATVATWQSLLPPATATASAMDASACYPRALYGAAHLVSVNSTTSYIALHGGLALRALSLSLIVNVSDSVCLLELAQNGTTRWLTQPSFAKGAAPQARYRHACAARPGLAAYSMTCYGGVDAEGPRVLADAWTLTLPSGVTYGGPSVFIGSWALAPANYSGPRPGPRADHWMMSVRGATSSASSSSSSSSSSLQPVTEADFSPLLLIGGSSSVTAGDAPPRPPHQAVWLLEAAACADPDAALALSGATPAPDRRAQVWLSVLPSSTLRGSLWESETLAAAGLVKGELGGMELWLLLAEGGPGEVGDVRALRAAAPAGGCLSSSVRPWCSNMSYSYDAVVNASCWPNAGRTFPIVTLTGDAQSLSLFTSAGGFVLRDPDGAALHFKNFSRRFDASFFLTDVQLPPGLTLGDITLTAYGKPYIELGNSSAAITVSLALPAAYNLTAKVRFTNTSALLPNASTEIRVRGGDGLARRRRSASLQPGQDLDTRTTNGTGVAVYQVMSTSAVPQPENVSYVLIVTPANSKVSYSVPLRSPAEAATGTALARGDDGSTSSLQMEPTGAVYDIVLPPPPPDNLMEVSFNVSFQSPNGSAVQFPTLRRWTASLIWQMTETAEVNAGNVNDTYYSRTLTKKRLEPGLYMLEMYDTNTSWDLKPSPISFNVPTATANGATVVTVFVPLSSVFLSVTFAGVLASPAGSLAPGYPKPVHVMVRLSTLVPAAASSSSSSSSGASGVVQESLWDDVLVDDKPWALLPGVTYRAVFHFAKSYTSLYDMNFTAPILTADGRGGYKRIDVVLPQTLLCGGMGESQSSQLVAIQAPKGRLPVGAAGPVAYASEYTCEWRISTGGLPSLTLTLNYSGLSPGDAVYIKSDAGSGRLMALSGTFTITDLMPNITLQFRAGSDSVMNFFVIEWAGQPGVAAMPPQFIMMIAASSAAAGAMLLFLCLWHCVFRPVQLRRQQAAAAMAAAASAAANPAGGAPPGGRGANRNRVPRRYLRMMATSLYSAKDAASARGQPRPAGPSASPPLMKDSSEKPDDDATAAEGAEVTAALSRPGENGAGAAGSGPQERPSSAAAAIAAAMRCDAAMPGGGVAAAAAAAAPASAPASAAAAAPPSSYSGPACQSEPEAAAAAGGGGEVCAICLCEFEEGERIKHLPCKHFYHVACIDQWLGRDITCPLCKDNVLEALTTMFGPLPPKNGGTRQGQGQGAGGGRAEATEADAQQQQQQPAETLGTATAAGAPPGSVPSSGENTASAAVAAGGGGAAAAAAAGGGAAGDLEMVVIMQHDPAAAAAAGGGGAPAGSIGPGRDAAPWHLAAAGLHSPQRGGAGAGGAPPPAGTPTVLVVSAAAGGGGGGGTLGAGLGVGLLSTSASRELRPMRRNISADLTADQDGTSSESDSGDSEYDARPPARNRGRQGSSTGAAASAAVANTSGGASARGFQVVRQPLALGPAPPPPPHASLGGWAASNISGGGDGNQLTAGLPPLVTNAASLAASAGGGAASYYETGGLAPSPRPVVEHVQRSPCSGSSSSGTAMRWISGTSQVAPEPRPTAALAGGPTMHRLAREAQMAVAAAALSAAAAGVSNGGAGGGGGGNSWRTASSTSIGGGGSGGGGPALSPYLDAGGGGGGGAATTAMLSYRVHNNPLALSGAGSRSDMGSPRRVASDAATLAGAATAAERTSGPASPAAATTAAVAAAAHHHAVSVVFGGVVAGPGGGGGGGGGRSRPGSASSASHPPRAVPEVSASCEDVVRPLSSQQQQQQS